MHAMHDSQMRMDQNQGFGQLLRIHMHSRVYLGRGCYNSPLLKRNFVTKILVSEMLTDEDNPPHLLSVSLVLSHKSEYNFQVVTQPLNHSMKHVLLSFHLAYSLLLSGIFLILMIFPIRLMSLFTTQGFLPNYLNLIYTGHDTFCSRSSILSYQVLEHFPLFLPYSDKKFDFSILAKI